MTMERFSTKRARWLSEAYVQHDIELRRQLEREQSESGVHFYVHVRARAGGKHRPSPTAAADVGSAR